jgi:hypothetical protein
MLKELKNMDLLTKEPITLMSEGKSHYTTLLGGAMTVLMCLLGFIILVALPSRIESMELQQVAQNNFYEQHDQKEVQLALEGGFNVAFAISVNALMQHVVQEQALDDNTPWDAADYDPLDYGELEIFFEG